MNTETQPPPPSKPRKEEILDVATRLFAERGYEGTSMNDVAELVGMRKASLFYHFATKDALYEAVLDRLVASLGAALGRAYGGGGSFADRLDQSVDTLIAVLGTHPYAARLLLREVMDWGPVIRGKLLESMLQMLEAGAAFLRAGQEAGEFGEGDSKQMVISAIGTQFMPFAIGQLVERYVGTQPFTPEFVAARRAAVRRQVRAMVLK